MTEEKAILWDENNEDSLIYKLVGHTNGVLDVVFSPNG